MNTPTASHDTDHDAHRPSVLIVEDHMETRFLLELVLRDDFEVDLVASPQDAEELASQKTYDVLILDIALGDAIDGVELGRRLRQFPGYDQVPQLAITAQARLSNSSNIREREFDAFMEKPFLPEQLLDTLQRLLQGGQ